MVRGKYAVHSGPLSEQRGGRTSARLRYPTLVLSNTGKSEVTCYACSHLTVNYLK